MKSGFNLWIKLTILALMLSACRVVVDTRVNPNGSGELRTAIVYTAEEVQGFEQTPGNESKSVCDNLKGGTSAEAIFAEEQHDGEIYCVTTRAFANLKDLRRFYTGMNQVTVHNLKLELGKFVYDVDVDFTGSKEGDGVANQWRLALPGTPGVHNADRVEGQTLVWEILPGEKANLHAESRVGLSLATLGPAGLVVLACLCGLAVLGGAGMVTFFSWTKRVRLK